MASAIFNELSEMTHGMMRTEVRSKFGSTCIPGGSGDRDGLRYFIDSASPCFVPSVGMEAAGDGPTSVGKGRLMTESKNKSGCRAPISVTKSESGEPIRGTGSRVMPRISQANQEQ